MPLSLTSEVIRTSTKITPPPTSTVAGTTRSTTKKSGIIFLLSLIRREKVLSPLPPLPSYFAVPAGYCYSSFSSLPPLSPFFPLVFYIVPHKNSINNILTCVFHRNGDYTNFAKLVTMLDPTQTPDDVFPEKILTIFDVDKYMKYLAVEIMVAYTDGYSCGENN
jgi:hypothetical protein